MQKLLTFPLVLLLAIPAVARAEGTGSLSGRVVVTNGCGPAKAVWLADAVGGSLLQTIPVRADGTFSTDALPSLPIALAVETKDGLYPVESPVAIAPGATRSLTIAIRGREDTKKAPKAASKKKSGNVWNRPLFASLIVIGGAIVVGAAVDQLTNNNAKRPPVSASHPSD